MKKWQKVSLWVLGLIIVIPTLIMVWYLKTHSMQVALSFEVNDPSNKYHILIASQGSLFKDSVVSAVLNELRPKQTYINVIDVSSLPQMQEEEWSAIIILHTWEYQKPPKEVKNFVDHIKNKQKLIMLSTSGGGTYKMEGIDAITSASQLSDVSAKAKEITARVEKLLN